MPRYASLPQALGSSPLARGLPRRIRRSGGTRRIIPARAGFTGAGPADHRTTEDHPRSRGVYQGDEFAHDVEGGSSPLARGLRDGAASDGGDDRIIPARAGFTSMRSRRWETRRDHPRSRGVYGFTGAAGVGGTGSSPLARGLRGLRVEILPPKRIIPARAGFTEPGIDGGAEIGDHPRSRGVYYDKGKFRIAFRGSSPLARGLPERDFWGRFS